jgi:hypothetical protein
MHKSSCIALVAFVAEPDNRRDDAARAGLLSCKVFAVSLPGYASQAGLSTSERVHKSTNFNHRTKSVLPQIFHRKARCRLQCPWQAALRSS